MSVIEKKKRNKEISYLEHKKLISSTLKKTGYENVLRYMIEELENMEEVTTTQSVCLFQILSALEEVLEKYPRIKNV